MLRPVGSVAYTMPLPGDTDWEYPSIALDMIWHHELVVEPHRKNAHKRVEELQPMQD